ncbi:hypothetical protein [Sphingobium sp. DC-2]|uniref:hypothetical protein n=1 Tax=Sphingobium sp. DC-2 TaxID=1303256 RepID=UPI000AAEEAD7|nr:hypothetical protein [Sphingobium sp. DC-2]
MTLTPLEIGLGLLVLLLLAGIAVMVMQNRRRAKLRSKFGPEYSRTVEAVGSSRKAEAELQEREKRVATFSIRPLSPQQVDMFTDRWLRVQTQFVDDPQGAVSRADVLLTEVMEERGYPIVDFERRSADLSVDHPEVVQNYRSAHDIAIRHARGEADTEDLRQAMIHYRALFEELVHEPGEPDGAAHMPRPGHASEAGYRRRDLH